MAQWAKDSQSLSGFALMQQNLCTHPRAVDRGGALPRPIKINGRVLFNKRKLAAHERALAQQAEAV
jgi:hypothetical protein